MARLLRLHLTSVGHKDARFFPLTLDFRGRDGKAIDTVVWLRNGGGKSSLLNLFYSMFLPESRKFLGSKAEGRERRLTDYVKASDLACIVSEWEMPAGANIFSTTRIVGQALAWRGGIATLNDEERLDREFFTFRGSDKVPFESLPIHGLGAEPKRSLQALREWLTQVAGDYRELEVERGNEGKAKWRQKLNQVGFDSELFNYQLTMNGREGGAAELFKVRDTMEFVDLFLEMALHPQQAEKTADQIESVREKLRKLPQRELEESFILGLLSELRQLAHDAAALGIAESSLREKRQENELLRTAIEHSIEFRKAKLNTINADALVLEERISKANHEKLAKQEYRLNYDNLFRRLTWQEAETERDRRVDLLQSAARQERIAEAAIRFAEISGKEAEFGELQRLQAAALAEQKPARDELNGIGAQYSAALDGKLATVADVIAKARARLSQLSGEHAEADGRLKGALQTKATTESEIRAFDQRLAQRDRRRADLRQPGLVKPKEKAAEALLRWEADEAEVRRQIEEDESRDERLTAEIRETGETENRIALQHQKHGADAAGRGELWTRGSKLAADLQASATIREVTSTELPDLDFAELPALLRAREAKLLDLLLQTRVDNEDDKRTLRSVETDRLFPASREVEVVLDYLRGRGVRTALPAYRFLATNVLNSESSREFLAHDPARFSGVVVTSQAEFATLEKAALMIAGLRHPVAITLSELPDHNGAVPKVAVALPATAGAYHYGAAAMGQSDVEERVSKLNERIGELEETRLQAAEAASQLVDFRREFGGGTLSRLAAERDQLCDEVARLAARLAELLSQRHALETERSVLNAHVKELRQSLPGLAASKERLRNYIEEYEGHEQSWIAARDAKQSELREIQQNIGTEEITLNRLHVEMESARAAVATHEQERTIVKREQDEIAYRDGDPPTGPLMLEVARTRYKTSLARFEERFGQSKLDGQIEEKHARLNELRATHAQESIGLSDEEITAAAGFLDLAARRDTAKRNHLGAHSALEEAKRLLQQAADNLPAPRAHKQGLGIPPDAESPRSAAEAAGRRDELDVQIEAFTAGLTTLSNQLGAKQHLRNCLDSSIKAREPLLTTLEGLTDHATGAKPSLPDDDQAIAALVRQAKSAVEQLTHKWQTAQKIADDRVQALLKITRREEFAALPPTARERFATIPYGELLQRTAEFVQGYEARQTVLRNEIETLTKDKDIVVRQLDGVATTALRLLSQAERASTMPDSFPGWTGLPFLRITTQPVTEPAARRDRLAALVDRLASEKAIPRGAALASLAVREIAGFIRATLLKPEDPLRPDRHDITEFATFSGGEKMTAAILLYVTLAQLRSRSRHDFGQDREAGVLILDNPLGTASKREFVQLQLRVAQQMGVQLIFTTGVNDLGALDVLPRILRLRKRHRDVRSGDLLLSQESVEEHIEGVQANLRKACDCYRLCIAPPSLKFTRP
jgi:hypothetical protein